MTCPRRARRALNRYSLLVGATGLVLFLLSNTVAQTLPELEGRVEAFQEGAQSIYRFDEGAKQIIWEAYCNLLDPNTDEVAEEYDRDFAFEIGLSYQQQQQDLWEELMGQVGSLMEDLEALAEDPEVADRAEELQDVVTKEGYTLQQLEQDVVLKGSNHPFVQFAIDYGMKMHQELCSREGESPKVCDKPWPTLDGRPDLVYVDDDGLWILEFKPDSDRARREGERQLLGYVEGVQEYFQDFFPNGREAGYTGTPDGEHGGEELLEKLMETEDAWDSDGEEIIAKFDVVTYDRCEQRF